MIRLYRSSLSFFVVYATAPVTFATIAPRNASRCSERRCFMHEKLVCTCDGRPKPKAFMWRVSVNYENFRHMVYRWPEQNTAYSGRNTLECRVFNVVGNITFTAVGRFITHVLGMKHNAIQYNCVCIQKCTLDHIHVGVNPGVGGVATPDFGVRVLGLVVGYSRNTNNTFENWYI